VVEYLHLHLKKAEQAMGLSALLETQELTIPVEVVVEVGQLRLAVTTAATAAPVS